MSIIGWIILGLIAGYIASKIVNRTGEGFVVDILLGIGGAVVGGWLFHGFGMWGVNGVNPCSFFFHDRAIVVLVAYHALFPRLSPCCQELLDSAVTPERGGLMSDRVSRVLMRWTSTHEAGTPPAFNGAHYAVDAQILVDGASHGLGSSQSAPPGRGAGGHRAVAADLPPGGRRACHRQRP